MQSSALTTIVENANELVRKKGVKSAMRAIQAELGLRPLRLYQDPGSYNSPSIKLWHRSVAFLGFTDVRNNQYGTPCLVFECEFTWTRGFGKRRETKTMHVERTCSFADGSVDLDKIARSFEAFCANA